MTTFFRFARVCIGMLAMACFASLYGMRETAAQATPGLPGNADEATQSAKIEQLVEQLSDPSYLRREQAMRKLTEVGYACIPMLESAIQSGNLELIDRASFILQDLALLETPNDQGIGWDSLQRIKMRGPGAAASRARSSLRLVKTERVERAQAGLAAAGIMAGPQTYDVETQLFGATTDQDYIVQIDESWNGDPDALNWLPWLYNTRFAIIEGEAVCGKVLEAITKIPSLRKIRLRDGELTAVEIEKLKAIRRIDILELHFVKFGNGEDDLFTLAELPVREQLILTGTDFSVEDYEALEGHLDGLEITFSRGGFLGVRCLTNQINCQVSEVVGRSAAERAGIEPLDVITELGGYKVERFEDLQKAVRRFKPGEQSTVKVIRGGKELEFEIDLGRYE